MPFRIVNKPKTTEEWIWHSWELDLLKLFRAEKRSKYWLGEYFGIPPATVCYKAMKLGVRVKLTPKEWEAEKEKIQQLIAQGATLRDLAKRYDHEYSHMGKVLKRLGLKGALPRGWKKGRPRSKQQELLDADRGPT